MAVKEDVQLIILVNWLPPTPPGRPRKRRQIAMLGWQLHCHPFAAVIPGRQCNCYPS